MDIALHPQFAENRYAYLTCSGFSSTRRWRNCGASRCWCRCASASATCGRAPDELLYLLTDETDGAVLRIEPAE